MSDAAATPDDARRAKRLVLALMLLAAAGELLLLRWLPVSGQVALVPDDSFFYLCVARWFALHGEFQFDGVNPTYGYQPLWQLLLCGLAPLLPTRAALFHGVQLLCVALHVAIGGALAGLARRMFGPAAAVVAAGLWLANPGTMVWCWGQKENALYALLLVLTARQLHTMLAATPTKRQSLVFGALLGAIVFTRINAALVSGLLWLCWLGAFGLGGGLAARARAALLAVPAALLVAAPWYVFAWLHFGSAMPTSGTFKLMLAEAHVAQTWGTPWLSVEHGLRALQELPRYLWALLERGYGPFRPLLLAAAALAPVAVAVSTRRRTWPGAAAWTTVAVLVAVAAAASFADQMLLPNYIGYADWYAVAFQVAVPVATAALLRPWLADARGACAAAGLAVLCAFVTPPTAGAGVRLSGDLLERPPAAIQPLEVGLWASRHTPKDARFALWDPGIVSYFSERRCTSLDPLIGAVDYLRPEAILDPLGYLKRQGIDYLFGVADRQPDGWRYVPLPPGTFDIVWMPYPDFEVGWRTASGQATDVRYVLVRPHQAEGAAFVEPDDLPFGLYYPNDPTRRRWLTGDRDRLLEGSAVAADAVRLLLALGPDTDPITLTADGEVVRSFGPGTTGWQLVDVRPWRGKRLRLASGDGATRDAVPQAHLVDHGLDGN